MKPYFFLYDGKAIVVTAEREADAIAILMSQTPGFTPAKLVRVGGPRSSR